MTSSLIAWRNSKPVARFTRDSGGARLEYASGVTEPLSLSLPVGEDLGVILPRNWLQNLLPDNKEVLNALAKRTGVERKIFDLIGAVGEDLPGSVSLLPEGQTPGGFVKREPVSETRILEAITRSKARKRRILPEFGTRLSLAGAQDKFSLSYVSGQWFESNIGLPSTHIFKPGPVELKNIESAESATLHLARIIGLNAAKSMVYRAGGVSSFCTERFDRILDRGRMVRITMEDLNQVAGRKTSDKYGLSFQEILGRLVSAGMPVSEVYTLVSQMIFNVHVGNADAHTKNYSILRNSKKIVVAPLYDSIPITAYSPLISSKLAMSVNGKEYSKEVGIADWIEWSSRLGLNSLKVVDLVRKIVYGIRSNVEDVYSEYALPPHFAQSVVASSSGIKL